MTFLELIRYQDDEKMRINLDHVSEYFAHHSQPGTILVYEDGKELHVKNTVDHIDIKIIEIEAYRRNK